MNNFIRPCNFCQEPYEAKQRYINRGQGLFCSRSCSSTYNSRKRYADLEPNVVCHTCDKKFYRSKSKQSISKSGLQFCTRKCKEYAQSLEGGVSEIQPSHYGMGIPDYRKLALESYPNVCNQCGYEKYIEVLQVHHIDVDRSNNKLSNLEVLCPTCHMEFHFETKTGMFWN